MPGGLDPDDSRRGQADEYDLGLLGLADDSGQYDTEADQDIGKIRAGGAEGPEKSVPEQQVDHLQRRIAGRFLSTKVPRLQAMDHILGGRLVLLRSQELQEQVAAAAASDDVNPVARDTRR